MTASIVVVSPIYKIGRDEIQPVAEAVWAAMPPTRRVWLGQMGAATPAYRDGNVRLPTGERVRAIASEAHARRGVRLDLPDIPDASDEELILALAAADVSVLITTPWFLSTQGPREQVLLDFLAGSQARMVGYIHAYDVSGGRYVVELVEGLRKAAGDRLLTLYRPPAEWHETEWPGRSIPAMIDPDEPLPEWLTSLVREHAGLPIPARRLRDRVGQGW